MPGEVNDTAALLIEIGTALCQEHRLRDLLHTMMERVRTVVEADACSVMLVDAARRELRWEVALGKGACELQTLAVPLGQGISGRVAATGEPIRIDDAQRDARWEGRAYDAATGFTTRSMLCVPIRARGRVIGVVQVLNRRHGPFTDADQQLLEALTGMGGVAIENARLYEHLEEKVEERTAELTRTLAELRDTQAQLVQSEKMAALGNLVAGVAHEINTPLGAVSSNADVIGRALGKLRDALRSPTGLDDAQRLAGRAAQLAEVSREACRRIEEIVRSLRAFSRLDEAERKPADLNDGLESTLTLVGHLTRDRIRVQREYGTLPLVDCYPNQLNQVFLNLLVNAAQAITGDGTITVRTRAVPDTGAARAVIVEVTDTGGGIPPEHLVKVFDPGFTTKGVGVGTGLGLAISYQIVAAHRGTIAVDSTPGTGSTFRVTLPVGECA